MHCTLMLRWFSGCGCCSHWSSKDKKCKSWGVSWMRWLNDQTWTISSVEIIGVKWIVSGEAIVVAVDVIAFIIKPVA